MNDFIKTAQEAAEKAGSFLKKRIDRISSIKEKHGAVDKVTDADLAVQELIINLISKNFPEHGILAEELFSSAEAGEDARGKKYLWAIDPIDGTSAYTSGLPTAGKKLTP